METELPVTPLPDWRAILLREVKEDPRKKAGVADRMGIKRAYVSRAVATLEGRSSGFPRGVPQSFISRVLDLEADVDCPAQAVRVARAECRKALAPAPTHNPLAMRIWRECQTCAIKPRQEAKS